MVPPEPPLQSPETPIPIRRPSILDHDADPFPMTTHGNGTLVSLIRNRSTTSLSHHRRHMSWHPDTDDEDSAIPSSLRLRDRDPDEGETRLSADEFRLSQIIAGPEMRSMRLIGNSNPRYRWERYWKTDDELQSMSKSIRAYYTRTNELVQQYLFIDRLLDSEIPHELLNEYSTELESSAFRPVDIPRTVYEGESLSPTSHGSYEETTQSGTTVVPTPTTSKPVKRSPKDIFRPPAETTPLLAHDEEEGAGSPNAPTPRTPWLDNAELDSDSPVVTLAIWVNFAANTVLLLAKCYVVLSVASMSVLASLVDALLDFLSTAIVWTTTRLIATSQGDHEQYPAGRRRLEPLGVLVFSVIMITSFFQVALESTQRLMSPEHEVLHIGLPALLTMVGTIVIKGAAWLWCRMVKNSSVQALAEDAKTDVIFNTGTILFPLIGSYAKIWWLDALGGLLLSCVVIFNWSKTSLHHVRNLTGFSAHPDERNMLLYLTMRFSTAILKIQNLRAYHAGDRLVVEVDIVLAPTTPLKDSHDLSEVLTYFLESVPIVDRAFVHVDYVSYNYPPTHM